MLDIKEEGQRSRDWYRQRLGKITGSKVGCLMSKGRNSEFSQTAMGYLYQLIAERTMKEDVVNDDMEFDSYLDATNCTTREMQWGIDHESEARNRFSFSSLQEVKAVGSVTHPTMPNFAASPDGLVDKDGVLEIKCTGQKNFVKYQLQVHDGFSLKQANPDYYWQVVSEMVCTERNKAYFVVYCPFQKNSLHEVLVDLNPDDAMFLTERVTLAEQFIENSINTIK